MVIGGERWMASLSVAGVEASTEPPMVIGGEVGVERARVREHARLQRSRRW